MTTQQSIEIENLNVLPNCTLYSKYLNIASFRFNLTINECRNKFGLYTMKQWNDLFNQLI